MKRAAKPVNDEFFILWVLIAQTRDAFLAAREREYYNYRIKNERRAALFAIAALGDKATPTEIARVLIRKINSVTEMLNRMEQQGLIKKYKSSGRSKILIKLTDKGYEIYHQSLKNSTDKRILSVLSKRQREQLQSYLLKIRNEAARELGIQTWSLLFSPDFNHEKRASNIKQI